MNRDEQIQILSASIGMAKDKRRPLGGEETLVPVTDYVDPERFERELALFRREFCVVTVSSRVREPGDFVTADVMGVPVIVARGDDGRLRGFLNVCRHRGATVERRAAGQCKRFVCPYHAWTYNNDGSLHKVRHADGFPTLKARDHGLVELACAEAAGLVFVCPTRDVTPDALPEALVTELETMLGPRPTIYASTARTWKANWKIVVEGGIESYHFKVAHKDTIASFFTDTQSTWQRIGAHMRSVPPKRSVVELEGTPQADWDIREHTHLLYTLHPNALILLQRTHFDLILMTPRSVDSTHLEVHTVGSAPSSGEVLSEKARQFLEGNHTFSVKTLDEDFTIGEEIQRGMLTGANTHFRWARFEDALTDWRRWLDGQLL